MEELQKILSLIAEEQNIINMFNIYIKFNKEEYLDVFKKMIEQIKNIETYDDFGKYLNNTYIKYKNIITYVKCYNVLCACNEDYIIFNDSLYNNLEELEDKLIYTNTDKNLIFKIENKSKNTNKLLNYLINCDNFINTYIKKRNKKTSFLTTLWKNEIFNNNVKIDVKKFNYKKDYDTKIYKETNKKYKIQKLRKIEFILKNEVITSSVRLSLPNSFIISLIDNSYICLNKIIISEKLTLGVYKFNNIREKVNFIFKLYKEFFNINIDTYEYMLNISLKILNTDKILYMNHISNIPNEISFTPDYIIIKYINSYEKLLQSYNLIETYIKKYKKYFKYFDKIKISNILYISNDDIDKFFF